MDINWTSIAGRAVKVAGTSYGQEVVGRLSQPVFADIETIEKEKLEQDLSGKSKKESTIPALFKAIKNNFAWGDLLGIGGLAGWVLSAKFLTPNENGELSFIKRAVKYLFVGMTVGFPVASTVGKACDLHRQFALGDTYAEALANDAERKGKPIFKLANDAKKQLLKEQSKNLNKTLIYTEGVKHDVLGRHEQAKIGGLFDGPPGTGKTSGVECVLGNWIDKVESEGKEAVIAELNLANFNDYIADRKNSDKKRAEALSAVDGRLGVVGSFSDNHGLIVLELLIKKIQRLRDQVAVNNQDPSNKKQVLAVFVDEFDKVFDPNTLKGCDKARLKALLSQFNELYVKENLLLTSNLTLEQIIQRLKQHFADEENGGEQVWGPIQSRMGTNRVYIGYPDPPEQALILAGSALTYFKDKIDFESFGLTANQLNGSYEKNREVFGAAIYQNITSKEGANNLSGRHLVEGVTDNLRSRLKPDDVKLTSKMLLDTVVHRQTQAASTLEIDIKQENLFRILENLFKTPAVITALKQKAKALKNDSQKITVFDLLEADGVYDKSAKSGGKADYISKQFIEMDGKRYHHILSVHPGQEKGLVVTEPEVWCYYAEVPEAADLKQISLGDYHPVSPIKKRDFENMLAPKVMIGNKDESADIVKLLFGAFTNLMTGGNPNDIVNDFFQEFIAKQKESIA